MISAPPSQRVVELLALAVALFAGAEAAPALADQTQQRRTLTMPEQRTSIERDFDDLQRHEKDWSAMKSDHTRRERELRAETLAYLRDYVLKASAIRRSNGVALTSLTGRGAMLTLEELVNIEDLKLDRVGEDKVLSYTRLVGEHIRPRAEAVRKERAARRDMETESAA